MEDNSNEIIVSNDKLNKWTISNKYETIIVGDAYCGKTTYLNLLVENEKKLNVPVRVAQDKSEFEFWVESKMKRAVFIVKDTASQERFRSLTQSYYRKAQCALLIFDLMNEESFYNLNKWYSDIMSYCKCQDNNFAIVLIGVINKKNGNGSPIETSLVEKFKLECSSIIDYCQIDLVSPSNTNLKQPLQKLFDHFLFILDARSRSSPAAFSRTTSPMPVDASYFNGRMSSDKFLTGRRGSSVFGISRFDQNKSPRDSQDKPAAVVYNDDSDEEKKKCCVIM